MTPEGQDEGFEVEEASTDALNSVEGPAHQNANTSNLDMRVHHHDLSQHNHHPLGSNSDPTNVVFPHPQHLQNHLNGLSTSTDSNHITGSDLLQQHLLTQALHNQPSLHHPEQQQQQHHHHLPYQQQHQLQQTEHLLHNLNHQTQQHPFSYHHDRHSSGVDENDSIVEATTALQHDVSVVDVGGMQEHAHPTDMPNISEHHHPNNGMSASRLIQQEHEHQMALGMVYHQQFQQDTQQLQQQQQPQHQTREQEDSSTSVDPTQTVGMASSIFPPHNSPLTLPPHAFPQISKKISNAPSRKVKKTATRSNNKKAGIKESRVTDKKRKLQQKGITASDRTSVQRGSHIDTKKPRRRRYDNNFKAEVLSHLKGSHTKLSDVARQYGIPENTLREWTKLNVVQAIESARSKNSGQLKANMYDPMKRLTENLMAFFEHNRGQPEHLRQSITTKLIVAKALEARSNLLQSHAAQPFLDPKEKKAIENFTGSDSWAKKFAKRRALKMTGARIKELSEEDINNFHYSLKQMSNRVKQAGPGFEESAMLIRQAAEKLLLASIIHSTTSHRLMGNVTPSNSRNDRKRGRGSRSILQSQQGDRQQHMDDQRSKVQPETI